jgi:hypothetical protein
LEGALEPVFAAAAVHVAIAAPVRKSHLRIDDSIPRGPSHCTVELHGQGFPTGAVGFNAFIICRCLSAVSLLVDSASKRLPVACDQRCQRRLAAARRAVQDDRGGARTPRPAGAAASPVAADLPASPLRPVPPAPSHRERRRRNQAGTRSLGSAAPGGSNRSSQRISGYNVGP